MTKKVLITGGAGFIGSHLADELRGAGYHVRVLDSLAAQVHGEDSPWPDYLRPDVERVTGDVQDAAVLRRALAGIDRVVHLAAMVGVGQSMYQVTDYVAVNDLGTATLLEALIERPVERLIVASSMSIYGEGLYADAAGHPVEVLERGRDALRRAEWDPRGPNGAALTPLPTPESKTPALTSVYALSKYVQERMCLMVGQAYGMETVALRFFNVYGTRQALSNPYTGVLAIFAARLLNGRPPLVFEDGRQRRDFVHVRDVARACRLALEAPGAVGQALNVGSGESHSVAEVANRLAAAMGVDIAPEITGRFRTGDIRHCFADTTRARDLLGFTPRVGFDEGLAELVEWLADRAAVDRIDQATDELRRRGLVA